MVNVYDATIYATFYNEKMRDDWLIEHGVNQSVPNGGPVTSYSKEYEGNYRDLVTELADALQKISKGMMLMEGREVAKAALKKIGR